MEPTRRRVLAATGVAATLGAAALGWRFARRDASAREVPPLPAGRRAGAPALNLLLVLTDQERQDLPAALPLPAHERLRERGTSFTRFHVNTTPCSPSRSNFYFGQHTQKTRMVVNLGVYPEPTIPPAMPSLGHYLRANGYRTAYKGKWHLSELRAHYELTYGRYPNSRDALEPFGFSDFNFDGDPHGSTWTGYKVDAQIAAESVHWLLTRGRRRTADDAPWLLAVNFVNPHDVMYFATGEAQIASRRDRDYLAPLAPAPVDPLYARRWPELPLPANRADDLARKPLAQRDYAAFCDMAYGRVQDTEEAWRAYQAYYFNCIRDADRHLGTVLDALEASGEAARTIVVFTSDHGEMAGAHGLRQKGPFMYRENTGVPFVVRHPDAARGARTDALGSAVDLVPTLLELAGVPGERIAGLYPELAGTSLAAAIADPATRTERDRRGHLFDYNTTHYIDGEFLTQLVERGVTADRHMPLAALRAGMRPLPRLDRPGLFRGIHDGRYKFARYFKPAEHHRPLDWATLTRHNQLELYDLQTDPLELNNLAHDPEPMKPLLSELNRKLDALVATEVGEDLGDELVGPAFAKRL